MYRKSVLTLIASTILLLTSFCAMASASTTISADPSTIEVSIGEVFTINITILNVTDLYAWDLELYYRNDVLNATEIVEGAFLEAGGETSFYILDFNDAYNATHGWIWAVCLLTGSVLGASGNGTLATITFRPIGEGNTTLNIYNTYLLNSDGTSINFTTADGQVTVTETTLLGDVDGDGDVDSMDLFTLAAVYGTETGDPLYNSNCDFDNDGDVDSMDLFTLAANFGKE